MPPGKTAQQHLEDLTWAGAQERYPKDRYPRRHSGRCQRPACEELALIAKLDYARYFLTVHDIVAFARGRKRKSSARAAARRPTPPSASASASPRSIPEESKLLFARFISENRGEPPDIDVDFEHERREEVIQYVYERYGRDRAAICATVDPLPLRAWPSARSARRWA